jgi:hypothetical protein
MALADWDARLITPERALRLAGDWPLYATAELAALSQFEPEGGGGRAIDRWQLNLRCRKDGQSITLLERDGASYETSLGDLLSAVLRHLVTAHDQSLSGVSNG